ncbi:salicylate hydroxylase [Hypoxylon rubiginosum]|uniref:Salicylate hydroxylase n=1 Tax=Hypoxylon rubiginosum TaxID=110542 RepID=A0ACC0CSC1_9PEZI|nr:salicylate hydroxylase [Hypoxylon rubiginosum]
MDNKLIRIAIIGGGLAGASAANALFHLPHVDVHVFESAPEFSERGAAVGLSVNAQRALNAFIPPDKGVLQKAGAVAMNSSRIILGSGKDAGTVIFDLKTGVCVHRASLLRELLRPLPKEILHPNKKLVAINPKASGVELVFKDGALYDFDAVIGADGIFSFVRQHVFRDAAPGEDYGPSPAGFWDCRNLVPLDKAKSTLGKELFEDDRRYSWIGDGAFIMHDILEDRTMVQCIVSAIDKQQSFTESRKSILTRQDLNETLNTWLGGPIASGMIDLTLNQPDTYKYSQWEHKTTPTYFEDRVCLMGDAAHASTPWMGAGAGVAVEDAMVLGALFANISSPKEITAAFKAYDMVRRPRCQKVVDTSRETGLLFCGEFGLDVAELRAEISTRWSFILDLDMEAHRQEAMKYFTQYKNNQ